MKRKNNISIWTAGIVCALMIGGCGSYASSGTGSSGSAVERPAEEISQLSESFAGHESGNGILEYDEMIELSDDSGIVTLTEG